MKLILKEYLASLKERNELDAILPGLLSALGLTVYSTPRRGTRQYGVDVAAYGSLDGGEEKVYLFSIKAGDLTRSSWDGDPAQSLRPSINEIIDTYIPSHLPQEHQNKPKIICLCFGGDIQEQLRITVTQFETANTKNGISFEEWNGDKLSTLIISSFLREELLPKERRSLLRKALAFVDEPEISYKFFLNLVLQVARAKDSGELDSITALRQLNICLWILHSWSRQANNLEASYLASELTLLQTWNIAKPFLQKTTKEAKVVWTVWASLLHLYNLVSFDFIAGKVLPYVDKSHALSVAIRASNKVDVNLKMFDLLGRLALLGVFCFYSIQSSNADDEESLKLLREEYFRINSAIKHLIVNNRSLMLPYKDDQAIDISIAVWFLSLDSNNDEFIKDWLMELINLAEFNFNTHGHYPCNIQEYYELIDYPELSTDEYRAEITQGSILYPTISLLSAILNFDELFRTVALFKETSLEHCNFQLWFPDDDSEKYLYTNESSHGLTLSDIKVTATHQEYLNQVFDECKATTFFDDLSVVKLNLWPLLFVASRHYRFPLPCQFFKMLYEFRKASIQNLDN
ncbi:hypothetical protein DTO96_100555 [Ephemeroptericola cinctiostellae]|uniref:Chemotaxis protein n=1 Tax=Ephemeroptericola cinctiostellae TaxID=2268024 RepID=A0A345D907_9BURK|nr:hypothetical protein [Ephemeroptericola cinctiostellae]AXF84845.1 hypothetical protein DTO96_100555 [Ephemeroptericola cinctiostellae]